MNEQNRTIDDLVEDYKMDFIHMEDSYFEVAGHYPAPDETDFYECKAVKKVDCLLHLWWDLRDYRDSQKQIAEDANEEN